MYGWEYWCGGFWWIFPIFMISMGIVCVFLMRRFFCMSGWKFPGRRNERLQSDSAEEILKKRYALGEIDRKQYEEILTNITRGEK